MWQGLYLRGPALVETSIELPKFGHFFILYLENRPFTASFFFWSFLQVAVKRV